MLKNILFISFWSFFKEKVKFCLTLFSRIKLKFSFLVIWYPLEILFIIEKLLIFFISSFFFYHGIFLKNFDGKTPEIGGLTITSFFDYFTLHILIFSLWSSFFLISLGFLFLLFNTESKNFCFKILIFCLSIVYSISSASAGSEQEASELAAKMAYLQYLGDAASQALFMNLPVEKRNLLAQHFGNNFVGEIGWNSKGFLHLAAFNQQGISFQAFTRDFVKEECITFLNSNTDFTLLSASRSNLNNLLCVFPDKDDENTYVYSTAESLSFPEFLQHSKFNKFITTSIDHNSKIFLSKLALGDVITATNQFVEWKAHSVIDITSFNLQKEFDLDTHLARQVFYKKINGIYFREPASSTLSFSELTLKPSQELAQYNYNVISKRQQLLAEVQRNPMYKIQKFDTIAGSYFSGLLKKLK